MKAFARLLVLLGAVGILGGLLHAQSDSSVGTWKVNLAKSKYSPGPAPKSEMRVYEPWGNGGIKGTFTTVDADGKSATRGYEANYDGKDYKYTGSADFDMIALKRIDKNTTEATLKKGGKVVQTTKAVVSSDGKMRTLTTTGTNAKEQAVKNTIVLDKQ